MIYPTFRRLRSGLEPLPRLSILVSRSAPPTKVQKGGIAIKKLQAHRKNRWLEQLQNWHFLQQNQCVSFYCFDIQISDVIVTGKHCINSNHNAMNIQQSHRGRPRITGSSRKRITLPHWIFLMRVSLVRFLEVNFNSRVCGAKMITSTSTQPQILMVYLSKLKHTHSLDCQQSYYKQDKGG
jgi:hypothetical protein